VDYAVEAFQLEKSFARKRLVGELLRHPFRRAERVHALRGVDVHIRRGEIFGLLGPNGAGKTTLVKIFACLVLPDRGYAVVDGEDTRRDGKVKPKIGLVNSDERSFYWRLSGRENLEFFAHLYDVPSRRVNERIRELLEKVEMAEAADRRFADYSSGMKQRLAIARALLHDPPILLMDEPTRSLDPASALHLRTFIADELKARDGKTILLATHNLREAEVLCDRLAILAKGKIRQTGTVSEVRRWGVQERRFRFELDLWPEGLNGAFHVVANERINGHRRVDVVLDGETRLDDVLRLLLGAGVVVHACDRVEPDLEDAFARLLAAENAREDA
jgi:ABC-2 type transport system ATP-binding protein